MWDPTDTASSLQSCRASSYPGAGSLLSMATIAVNVMFFTKAITLVLTSLLISAHGLYCLSLTCSIVSSDWHCPASESHSLDQVSGVCSFDAFGGLSCVVTVNLIFLHLFSFFFHERNLARCHAFDELAGQPFGNTCL